MVGNDTSVTCCCLSHLISQDYADFSQRKFVSVKKLIHRVEWRTAHVRDASGRGETKTKFAGIKMDRGEPDGKRRDRQKFPTVLLWLGYCLSTDSLRDRRQNALPPSAGETRHLQCSHVAVLCLKMAVFTDHRSVSDSMTWDRLIDWLIDSFFRHLSFLVCFLHKICYAQHHNYYKWKTTKLFQSSDLGKCLSQWPRWHLACFV